MHLSLHYLGRNQKSFIHKDSTTEDTPRNLTTADLLTRSCYLAMPYQLQLFRTDDTEKDEL
jgi:hypothetical protein